MINEIQKENLKFIESKTINEAFLFEHELFKAVPVTDNAKKHCALKCALVNTMPCRCSACSNLQRKDKKNVIFVRTKKF